MKKESNPPPPRVPANRVNVHDNANPPPPMNVRPAPPPPPPKKEG